MQQHIAGHSQILEMVQVHPSWIAFAIVESGAELIDLPSSSITAYPWEKNRRIVAIEETFRSTIDTAFASSFMDPFEGIEPVEDSSFQLGH